MAGREARTPGSACSPLGTGSEISLPIASTCLGTSPAFVLGGHADQQVLAVVELVDGDAQAAKGARQSPP